MTMLNHYMDLKNYIYVFPKAPTISFQYKKLNKYDFKEFKRWRFRKFAYKPIALLKRISRKLMEIMYG